MRPNRRTLFEKCFYAFGRIIRRQQFVTIDMHGIRKTAAAPVSYTHLDVYKRQIRRRPPRNISCARLLHERSVAEGFEEGVNARTHLRLGEVARIFEIGFDQ